MSASGVVIGYHGQGHRVPRGGGGGSCFSVTGLVIDGGWGERLSGAPSVSATWVVKVAWSGSLTVLAKKTRVTQVTRVIPR